MPRFFRALLGALLLSLVACGAPSRTAPETAPADADAPDAAVARDTVAPAVADAPAAPRIPFETWAARLVDHPRARNGERDAVVADWFELLASEPGHPLAEGTLTLLAAVEPDLEHPQEFRAALLALDPDAGFTPLAAGQLRRMQARARSRGAPPSELPAELFADSADRALLLGPLPPADDPLAVLDAPELLTRPDFDAEVAGLDGAPLRWRLLERSGELGRLQVSSVLDDPGAWLLLAFEARLPGGGPGFLELDLGGSAGASTAGGADQLFAFGGSTFRGFVHGAEAPPPSFGWSLNGAPPRVEAMGHGERSGRVFLPVVFRDGVNRVVLRLPASGVEHFSLRALAPSGGAWPDAAWREPGAEPGAVVGGEPPARAPVDSVSLLAAREERGPLQDALLGVLLLLDRRPAQGLHHLERGASGNHLGPKALLAGVLDRLAFLPPSERRSRSRALIDEILERDPDFFSAGVARVEQWLAEDRELEALEHMRHLAERHTGHARGLLRLHALLESLGMPAEAQAVLEEAQARAPESPAVLERRAELARRHGRRSLALELEARALERFGRTAGGLEQLALRFTGEGDLARADALWSEALQRLPSRARRLRHARWLAVVDRLDEARARLAELRAEQPRDVSALLALADVSLLAGDAAAEAEALAAARAVAPGLRFLRLRTAPAPEQELVRAEAARWLVDTERALADFDPGAHGDSVVKVLDQAYVHVFDDGVYETITHDLLQLRDLAAVNRHGERAPPGEVLSLATLDPDGRRHEPVLVGRSYVMPNLQPGDFVEQVTRLTQQVRPGRAMRPGGWFFQSMEMPFLRSRYVVSLPADHDLELVQHGFEGTHEVHTSDDRVVHVFEVLDSPRLLPERGAPPPNWILPRVEFGQDADLRAEHHRLLAALGTQTEPTPAIRERAAQVTDGLEGEQFRARALYAFVQDHLQVRWNEPTPASDALLTREGNAALLYASLLRAAQVPHELVASRDIAPAADPEPAPDFDTAGRLTGKLLVAVQPADGASVFCDPSERGLPYGKLRGDAPGAEAMAVGSGHRFRMPEGEPEDAPGLGVELSYTLAPDGSAEVSGVLRLLGAAGFSQKAVFRQQPEATVSAFINQQASGMVPDLDMRRAWLAGLDEPGERLGLAFVGRVPRFVDPSRAGELLERPLPLPALQLAASVSSEGERRLPYYSPVLNRLEFHVSLDPGDAFAPAELPPELDVRVAGLAYRFRAESDDAGVLHLERVLDQEPFVIEASEHHELVELAARVDELERARLRLRRR